MRRLGRRQDGQAHVEFAIVTPLLLMLVIGIVQFGIVFHDWITLTDATRAGARQAAVSRTLTDPVGITETRVRKSAAGLDSTKLAVTVIPYDPSNGTNTWAQGGEVTVTATYPYSVNLLGIVVKGGNLKSQTVERVE